MRQFINSIIPTLELLIILMRWIFSNMTLKLKQYFEVRFQVLGLKQQNETFNDICVTLQKTNSKSLSFSSLEYRGNYSKLGNHKNKIII